MTKKGDKPVFVLGVGAQKAGTSWLHNALHEHPSVNMGAMKEYHIWDAILKPELFEGYRLTVEKNESANNALRRLMQSLDGFYGDYFRSLVSDRHFVTGDITPSYGALDKEHFALIREKLELKGFRLSVIFIMRDPVFRNWSAARMHRRIIRKKNVEFSDQEFYKRFSRIHQSLQMQYRTRYEWICESLKSVFSPDELYFSFYENMFEAAELRKLSDFLGVDIGSADTGEKFNASLEMPIPDHLYNECREFYSETYDYCFENYLITRELWKPDSSR